MKRTVHGGRVLEPYHALRFEDGKPLSVWFYASKGKFEFLLQESIAGVVQPVKEFSVPTRMIRSALRLIDRKSSGESHAK